MKNLKRGKVRHFAREICGTVYHTGEECGACEEGHMRPIRVEAGRYEPARAGAPAHRIPDCVKVYLDGGWHADDHIGDAVRRREEGSHA